MKSFRLRLRPPSDSFSFSKEIPVFLSSLSNSIGVCTIQYDNLGMIGGFELESPVDENQYVYYYFDLTQVSPTLCAIVIDSHNIAANSIANSLI